MEPSFAAPTSEPAESASGRGLLAMGLGLFLAAVGLALGFWLGRLQPRSVSADAPEVGFARDMSAHHAQAVEMAMLLRDRTEDPEMRQLALDILLTQQAQIGQMHGWLAVWGESPARTGPAMAWMGMPTSGLMPGMVTREQLDALQAARGLAADGLFLQLMIPHHHAGVAMAQAILDRTSNTVVGDLARSIAAGQASEIDYMQSLLERKGFPPVEMDAGGREHSAP